MNNKKRVLVLDGRLIATIAIIRSLGQKGLDVTCGEENIYYPGFFSRYVKDRVTYPSPIKEPDLFMEKIFSIVQQKQYDLIIPVSDETTMLVSQYRDELSKHVHVFTPDFEKILIARDKAKTMMFAIEKGVPCPRTFFPDDCNFHRIKDEIEYPVLIKPCVSNGARGIKYINSYDELIYENSRIRETYGKTIIQEYIHSNVGRFLLHTLFNEKHRPVAVCVIQAIRCFPENGGPTAFGKTVIQEDVIKYGLDLLEALKWTGVAEVEFLLDARDNRPKLMEINHRFGNPVGLAIGAGVDIPGLLYEIALKGNVEPNFNYKLGEQWRWFFAQDLLWFLTARKNAHALDSFFNFLDRNLHYAVMSFSDPFPLFGIILQSLNFLTSKVKRDSILKRGW